MAGHHRPGKAPVTTCVVVWIEIVSLRSSNGGVESPPAWWCGLKFKYPDVTVWGYGHHLRGGVD